MRVEWEVKLAELIVDQPHAVAFIAFTDAWPRAIETEIGAALCAIGRRKGLFDIFYRLVLLCCILTVFSYSIRLFVSSLLSYLLDAWKAW